MTEERQTDRRTGLALLALLVAAAGTLFAFYVPRLNNYVMSDREFTGWTGPIAERIASGERPYVDFVLPIPPGSFAFMASIQKATGEALLAQELWVAALSQLLMAVFAYAIAIRLTTRFVAVLAALGTLVTLMQLPKECVYDHTAQVLAWGSLVTGVRALQATDRARQRWFLATGFLAVFTMGFKQSTATGVVAGWAGAIAYVSLVHWREQSRAEAIRFLKSAVPFALGGAAGLVAVWLLLVSVGSTVPAYIQAVFGDAPDLKGGSGKLIWHLFGHVFRREIFPGSFLLSLACVYACMRIARHHGKLRHDVVVAGFDPFKTRLAATFIVLGIGGAVLLLVAEARELPREVWTWAVRGGRAPGFGLVFLCVFFVGRFFDRDGKSADPTTDRAHGFNAMAIAALGSSLLHDASFSHFTFFYNNNPIIPFAYIALFCATEQLRFRWATALALALTVFPLYGRKLNRALSADTAVPSGHWAGLRVNFRGVELLRAAERIRKLAGPRETVLVLPEDVQFAALVRRPRPPIQGAIVFVDQYAKRLAKGDVSSLDRHPPKVIVIHPRKEKDWRRLFATWNEESGSAVVMEHVLGKMLPTRYRLDSSFRTVHFWDQGVLDVYVRIDSDAPVSSRSK